MDLSDPKTIARKIYVEADEKYSDIIHHLAFISTHYDGIGIYVRKNLIDFEMVRQLMAGDFIMMFEKLEPLFVEIRKVTPFTVENFEWLYHKIKDVQVASSVSK